MRNRFAKFAALLALAACLAAGAARAEGHLPKSGIAATVNDDIVTVTDVQNRLDLYLAGSRQAPPPQAHKQMVTQILDKLIDEKLELQEAKRLGITVDDAQVKDGFASVAQQNHLDAEEFRHRLSASGVHVSTLEDQIRAEIAWSLVVRRKLRPQISVSESEIDTAIDQISRGKGAPSYQVGEILLPVSSDAVEDVVRHDAEKMVDDLRGGAPFEQLARKYSRAPGAAAGGDLGWIQRGQLDAKLDAALAAMHPGQFSDPIRTDKGYHILFLRNVREGGTGTVEQAQAPAPAAPQGKGETIIHLRQIVIPVAKDDPPAVVSAKLNRAASLKSEVSSCDDMAKKAKDFAASGTGDLGSGPLSALPPQLRKAVENLPVGALSPPIRGRDGIGVLMVCDRRDASAPAAAAPQQPALPENVSKDDDKSRDQVANQIGMHRLDQMQEHYLGDLRATAFIEKRI